MQKNCLLLLVATRTLLKYILPLGFLFALALYCSNRAYLYSSVAFLQFCKEGNVALIFAMSCLLGLQARQTPVIHIPGDSAGDLFGMVKT